MIPSSYSRWISGLTLVDDADAASLAFFLSRSEAEADAAPPSQGIIILTTPLPSSGAGMHRTAALPFLIWFPLLFWFWSSLSSSSSSSLSPWSIVVIPTSSLKTRSTSHASSRGHVPKTATPLFSTSLARRCARPMSMAWARQKLYHARLPRAGGLASSSTWYGARASNDVWDAVGRRSSSSTASLLLVLVAGVSSTRPGSTLPAAKVMAPSLSLRRNALRRSKRSTKKKEK